MRRLLESVVVLLALTAPVSAAGDGGAYSLEDGATVIGWVERYTVRGDESLHEVALRTGLGYNEVVGANPGIDPWTPEEGTAIVIPKLWVLPHAPQEGIVINLAEMRLYHYIKAGGRKLVRTYPVGIGREAFDTPTGTYVILEKKKDPAWTVPESVREEDPSLPPVVPPGPDNPLGEFALRLSNPAYLIHGTNRPLGIGRRVSHGCIRMYPGDIARLYRAVEPGTPVRIAYQPVKAGERGGVVYVEAHRGYLAESGSLWDLAVGLLRERGLLGRTDSALLHEALEGRTGVPVAVTNPPSPPPVKGRNQVPPAERIN